MNPSEYASLDALDMAARVRAGDTTPDELLDLALARQREVNEAVNAIVIPMENEARAALATGLPDGPLRGVPFLLKDLHSHYAGVRTTSGSRFFADFVPDHDAEITARYRRAGLVIFGKTATPEFGLTTTTESTLFGPTRNPWNLEHTTGGSSGGSAAAVATGIVPVANASDGGGSIRIPASCCGLFGLKPTRARNPAGPDSGEGWSGMSTAHVVSRSVRDSAALLDATEGPDLGAPYWAPPPGRPYLEEVGHEPGRLRVAVQRATWNGAETHPDCLAALDETVRLCSDLGHEILESKLEIDAERFGNAARVIIFANVGATVSQRAAVLGRDPGPDDLEPMTHAMLGAIGNASARDYAEAIQTIHALGRQVERHLASYDVLLSPTMATPPLRIGDLSLAHPDPGVAVAHLMKTTGYTQLLNASGHPAMSVPLHWNEGGLPIGMQFVARLGDEATLFRLAAQLETARPWRDRRPSLACD